VGWVNPFSSILGLGSKPVFSGGTPSSSAVGLQKVYLDSVDNLRLGEAGPPFVPQAPFEGSAVLVRIAGLNCSPSGSSMISTDDISSAFGMVGTWPHH
jgi:hypothetical protein